MDRNLRILIVGCGRQGEKHLKAYLSLGNVEPLVCELDESRAKELKHKYRVSYVSNFYKALISLANRLDAVDICTPTWHHYEQVMAALKAGLHVLCEKPLVPTVKEAREIADLAKKSGLQVMVGFLYRFHPAVKFIKHLLDSNELGRPYLAIFRIGGRGSHRKWKHLRERCGGAVLEMMLHMLDLALWFFGDIDKIEVTHGGIILGERVIEHEVVRVTAEDYALCCFRSKSGVEIVCEADQITPSYMNYMEILGERGNVFASILEQMSTLHFTREEGWKQYRFGYVNLIKKELSYFVNCLARGEPVRINTAEEYVKVVEIADEIRRRIYDYM